MQHEKLSTRWLSRALAGAVWCTITSAACTAADDTSAIGTQNEGSSCKQISDCKPGLDCVDGVCTPLESVFVGPQRGDPCNTPADCAPLLYCSRQGHCSPNPDLEEGAPCGMTIECAVPLVCSGITGTCTTDGQPGTADFGDDCQELTDCQRPYVCDVYTNPETPTCTQVPFYPGPVCSRSDIEAGAFRVYYELPPENPGSDYEFYRLPFPNDIRFREGQLSLAGHAAPENVLGIDVPGLFFSVIEEDARGFAINQPVFFRFSDYVDHASVCLSPGSVYPTITDPEKPPYCSSAKPANVLLINIDPASASYNDRVPIQLAMSRDAGQYICQNWLGIAPLNGQPLAHRTTYAAIITTGVHDIRGESPIRDKDFADIMNGDHPMVVMRPLWDWIDDTNFPVDTIAAATVFTTDNPDVLGPKLRQAVLGEPTPAFDNNAVVCDQGAVSPCEDGLSGDEHLRGCFGAQTGFNEIQGTYQNPTFQEETRDGRPFLDPVDGGGLALDPITSNPIRQDYETVCYALAVPEGTAPPEGFPLIIYGHGTGGSYRSFVSQGLATTLTGLGYAVLGFDNVMHGRRQQPPGTPQHPATWEDPGPLFFNLANPRASLGNVLQGGADLFHLMRLVRSAAVDAPTGQIYFTRDDVYYLGHSQGTVIAPPFLAAESNLKAAALSGAGAELALSILNKKKPNDISQVAGAFFGDQGLSRIHPVMGLLAMLFGPADSVSYASTWILNPESRSGPLPLLQFSGIGDSYTPDVAQNAQIRATGLPFVGIVEIPPDGINILPSPQQNNLNGVTAAAVQLRPDGEYDGHFVMFYNPNGQNTLYHFFQTARVGDPEIIQ